MRGLKITQDNLTNQQGVVKNEVKVNVLNQPYGGFPWLDLPQLANTNWYNAHNFYGDLEHLDAATLADVQQFFKTYYAPNNAVLVVSGDIDTKQTLGWVRKYFAASRRRSCRRSPTSRSRARRRRSGRTGRIPLANRPALALGYHLPRREHARVLRDGADRSVARAGGRQPAVSVAGAEARTHRLGVGRRQSAARQHVRHQGADAVDACG